MAYFCILVKNYFNRPFAFNVQISLAGYRSLIELLYIVPTINSLLTQLLLDAQQLVIIGHTVRAAQ